MNTCPSCHNQFHQPFVCTTCGAEKLYDATTRTLTAKVGYRDQLLQRFIDLCFIGDVDETTEAYGWGDLIRETKRALDRVPATATIDQLWENAGHGTRREDIEAAYEAGRASVLQQP